MTNSPSDGVAHRATKLLLRYKTVIALALVGAEVFGGFYVVTVTTNRIQGTQTKLCDAALALAGFWQQVRASTVVQLRDRTLGRSEQIADQQFVAELTEAIAKAKAVGKC